MYQRSDFLFTHPAAVRCVNKALWFERPARLTKFDVAKVLQELEPRIPWTHIYDSFKYAELVERLNTKFG